MNGDDKYIEFQYGWTGDFYTFLFKAIGQADHINIDKMRLAFPEEVDAYIIWTRNGGPEALLKKLSPDHQLRERFMREYNLTEES